MPASITKYQIFLDSPSTPLPGYIVKEVVHSPQSSPPSAADQGPLVHAQLIDPSAPHPPQTNPTHPAKAILPNLFDRLRENPLTNPINDDPNSHADSSWKAHIGIGIAAFFLGASVAIILMLYLY